MHARESPHSNFLVGFDENSLVSENVKGQENAEKRVLPDHLFRERSWLQDDSPVMSLTDCPLMCGFLNENDGQEKTAVSERSARAKCVILWTLNVAMLNGRLARRRFLYRYTSASVIFKV
jgi:hypothetical protein